MGGGGTTRKGGAGRGRRMIVVTIVGEFGEPAPQIQIWGPPPPKNVERLISEYMNREKSTILFALTYYNR